MSCLPHFLAASCARALTASACRAKPELEEGPSAGEIVQSALVKYVGPRWRVCAHPVREFDRRLGLIGEEPFEAKRPMAADKA